MLAGAVALAAGHFQPLVRLEPYTGAPDDSEAPAEFPAIRRRPDPGARHGDFARRVEARVAALVARYDQLGDDCDFLTIAGDWPYRYDNDVGAWPCFVVSTRSTI